MTVVKNGQNMLLLSDRPFLVLRLRKAIRVLFQNCDAFSSHNRQIEAPIPARLGASTERIFPQVNVGRFRARLLKAKMVEATTYP